MSKKHFKQGDGVRFRFGSRQVIGTIKEDRGPIGVKGRHLYLVLFDAEPNCRAQIELPAEQLEQVEFTLAPT